jgi:RNA polymerase sigma factor (sigma-70 family)
MPAHGANDSSGPGHGDERSLLVRLAQGDEPALREIMKRYDRLVRYTIFRGTRDRCAADPHWLDARASETWTGFVQSARRRGFQPPDDLATYLIQIARNKCRDALRIAGAVSSPALSADEQVLSQFSAEHEDTADIAGRLDELAALRECLEGLDAEDRALCAHLPLIMDRRWKEAAERLGLAESTLRSRWDRVLRTLRDRLGKKT